MNQQFDSQLIEHADGSFELQWHIEPPQRVSVWQALESADFTKVDETEAATLTVAATASHARHHFKLKAEHGAEQILTQRRFKLDGAPNFRDFGGYQSQFGGTVKWGKLFRSGRLSALSKADFELLHSLGIHTIYDLRQHGELKLDPTVLPEASPIQIRHLPIVPGNYQGLIKKMLSEPLSKSDAEKAMLEVFGAFVTDQTEHFKQVVDHLSHYDEPLLVHCSAGKDRTGATAAFILLLLGVSRDDILKDYLLTARYYPSNNEFSHIEKSMGFKFDSDSAAMPLMSVTVENLAQLFNAIDENFASEAAFFEQALGIDQSARESLLKRWLD